MVLHITKVLAPISFFGGGGNDNFNASGAAVSDHVDGGGGTSNYFSYGGGNNETVNLSGAGDANGNGIADYIDAGIYEPD